MTPCGAYARRLESQHAALLEIYVGTDNLIRISSQKSLRKPPLLCKENIIDYGKALHHNGETHIVVTCGFSESMGLCMGF